MKTLQINKYYYPHLGGIETIVGDINRLANHTENDIDVLCFAEEAHAKTEVLPNSTIYRAARQGVFLGMPVSWDFFKQARKLIPQYDLVILHHPFPLGFLVYWLYGRNKTMVVWYHSDIVRQKVAGFLLKPLLIKILTRAKKIIVSHKFIAESSRLLKPFKNKIISIPFSVGQKIVVMPNTNDPLKLLSVGRLVYYKGYEYLVKAMKDIPAELTIIGAGPLKQTLLDLISKQGLTNIKIIDPVEDLSSFYQGCDIFILPSVENSEAFGLVQLEAMTFGKPVINTNLPTAVPTVSVHNQTGLTVEPKNSQALHDAILILINNSQLRKQYGEQARKLVEENYSSERFQNNLQNLFTQLTDE